MVSKGQEKYSSTPEDNNFTQPNLWSLEAEQPKETELADCLVLYHLALTQAPQMVVKEKRVSTTVYEHRCKRR